MVDAGGIRAGRAYVELSAKSSALEKGLKDASKKLEKFGASIAGIGAKVGALGAGITAETKGNEAKDKAEAEAFRAKLQGAGLLKKKVRTGEF